MKLVPHDGIFVKEYVGEIAKSFDKFQVVPSSMNFFTTNLKVTFHQRCRDRARDEAATPLTPAIRIYKPNSSPKNIITSTKAYAMWCTTARALNPKYHNLF